MILEKRQVLQSTFNIFIHKSSQKAALTSDSQPSIARDQTIS